MMKFYKGKEYEITSSVEYPDGTYFEYICDDGDVQHMPDYFFFDTKEESLANWTPMRITDINRYHKAKFGSQDKLTQIKKLYEETVELFHELEHYLETPDNLDKIKDELGDVIQASAGLFLLNDVMNENFKKLANRVYPDGFKHK